MQKRQETVNVFFLKNSVKKLFLLFQQEMALGLDMSDDECVGSGSLSSSYFMDKTKKVSVKIFIILFETIHISLT